VGAVSVDVAHVADVVMFWSMVAVKFLWDVWVGGCLEPL